MVDGASVAGMWERTTVFCMNHEHPVPMQVIRNDMRLKSPFYACSQYYAKDGVKEGSGDARGALCSNRLNLDDYQGLVIKFFEAVQDAGLMADMTNYAFDYRGTRHKIHVRCLKYTKDEIWLGIKNLTVLGQ